MVHLCTGPLRCVNSLTKISMKIDVVMGDPLLVSQFTQPEPTWHFSLGLLCICSTSKKH
jgi:hypothetical protein